MKATQKSEWIIYLKLGPSNDGSDSSSLQVDVEVSSEIPDDSTSEDEACVVPFQKCTCQKRPGPGCTIYDEEI